MKTLQTLGILFWINLSRAKDQEAELYARITVNGKRCNINLKHKVSVKTSGGGIVVEIFFLNAIA